MGSSKSKTDPTTRWTFPIDPTGFYKQLWLPGQEEGLKERYGEAKAISEGDMTSPLARTMSSIARSSAQSAASSARDATARTKGLSQPARTALVRDINAQAVSGETALALQPYEWAMNFMDDYLFTQPTVISALGTTETGGGSKSSSWQIL